ncbi:piggyBac transposable element-derived protein 2-like isoform X1 [Drosophila mojavensis]|uniref:piggyBac transposable element-derived protein 2-like isoform X1 n=1 Tax=Drosophila mojavensis TaxID=7230 RepID=UPI0013EEB2F5|nr:piggyBac transposable element-derived protein 2-like isoform X1 [Drosophila mojavensis]
MSARGLTPSKIARFFNSLESEDEFEFSANEESDFEPDKEELDGTDEDKPHKWGYRIYVLSGQSGFCYKFEIDSGNENKVLPNEPDLGAASNCVVRMVREVPRHQNFRIYFDNFFNSLPILKYLADEGILALGTIRRKRIPNNKTIDNINLKKHPSGTSVEYVADFDGVDISVTSWLDNKVVSLASNYAGILLEDKARRFNKAKKEYVEIDRPFAVAQYNSYMGGVDLIDSIIGRYKTLLRSRRWQVRIFYHLLDLTVSNAWLLYKRVHVNASITKLLGSSEFRINIAEVLTKIDTKSIIGKRSSMLENELQQRKQRGPTQRVPNRMVRQDDFGHWPLWGEKRIRCKYPKCTGFSSNGWEM